MCRVISPGELDLNAFAEQISDHTPGLRCVQLLKDIKKEVRFPYFDGRAPLGAPSAHALFELLTGERLPSAVDDLGEQRRGRDAPPPPTEVRGVTRPARGRCCGC